MRTLVLVGASALIGGMLFNRFLADHGEGTGMVPVAPGFGMDDVAHAAAVAGTFYVLHRFAPRF